MNRQWYVLLTVCSAVACGGSGTVFVGGTDASVAGDLGMEDLASPPDLTGAPPMDLALAMNDLAMPADLSVGVYPAGPYGNTVGATIPPLVWEGYPDPLSDQLATKKTYGTYSMDDMRKSGRPYGIVHVAEFF